MVLVQITVPKVVNVVLKIRIVEVDVKIHMINVEKYPKKDGYCGSNYDLCNKVV